MKYRILLCGVILCTKRDITTLILPYRSNKTITWGGYMFEDYSDMLSLAMTCFGITNILVQIRRSNFLC